MKHETTETLIQIRKNRKSQMEVLQGRGWWDVASNYHETYIAPINVELEKRGIW